MRRSFDMIGDVAIIEARTKKEEQELVKQILSVAPRVKTILKKESDTRGLYRLRKYHIVYKNQEKVKQSGLGSTETIHIEHGCRFKVDIRKAYFSPREGTIRSTLADLVHPGERVLVMFSGVGTLPIRIAKKVDCDVVGVDVNPAAYRYGLENVKLNNVQDRVKLFCQNIRLFHAKKFDRIVMPLGISAYKFLDVALKLLKKGGVIHLYGWGKRKHPYQELEGHVAKAAGKRKWEVIGQRIVNPYSPSGKKVCLDVKIY